jgi:hypothetical protein
MAFDAARLFGGMKRSQVNWAGGLAAPVIVGFGLGVARGAERIVLLHAGGNAEAAGNKDEDARSDKQQYSPGKVEWEAGLDGLFGSFFGARMAVLVTIAFCPCRHKDDSFL